jgi:serine/threonine-protein kinase HipA
LGVLLKLNKIDKHDYFSQLIAVGGDMVGAVTATDKS